MGSGSWIIFLSTDAVFDGLHGPYVESDAPSPVTVYGRCKMNMEAIISARVNAHIVRVSVVWGTGAVKQDVRRARYLEKKSSEYNGAINVFRSPVEVTHLARAIVRMTHEDVSPKILHLATPRMSYYDFLRTCLLPEMADCILPWTDPALNVHDSSLKTEYPDQIGSLLQ